MFDLDEFDPEMLRRFPAATEDENSEVIDLVRKAYGPLAPEDDDDKRDHSEDLIYFAKLYGWSFEQMVADDFKAVIGIAAMNSGGMN
jgi:hypothetical protein